MQRASIAGARQEIMREGRSEKTFESSKVQITIILFTLWRSNSDRKEWGTASTPPFHSD